MVGIMTLGPMETGKNQSVVIVKSMKSLLVQYYVRQIQKANHEIFR